MKAFNRGKETYVLKWNSEFLLKCQTLDLTWHYMDMKTLTERDASPRNTTGFSYSSFNLVPIEVRVAMNSHRRRHNSEFRIGGWRDIQLSTNAYFKKAYSITRHIKTIVDTFWWIDIRQSARRSPRRFLISPGTDGNSLFSKVQPAFCLTWNFASCQVYCLAFEEELTVPHKYLSLFITP